MSDTPKAYQRVTVELKQKHIDRGVRKSPCSCPLALAIREHFKTNWCTVLGTDNEVLIPSLSVDFPQRFLLSENAYEFIPKYDAGYFNHYPMTFGVFFPLDNP
jgi:hypothetical protein